MDIFIQQIVNGLVLGSIYAHHRTGLHHGLRHSGHHQLRARRCADGRRAGRAVGHHAGCRTTSRPACAEWLTLVIALLIAARGLRGTSASRSSGWPTGRCASAPRLAPLITAIGVSILLQTLAMLIWTRNPLPFPQLLPTDPDQRDRAATDARTGAVISMTEIVIIVRGRAW